MASRFLNSLVFMMTGLVACIGLQNNDTSLHANHGERRYITADDQLQIFGMNHKSPIGIMKTLTGEPIEERYTTSINTDLIRNPFAIELNTRFSRERIPERAVHAKGAGAFGYFKVTNDAMSRICKAKLFRSVGTKTPVVVRFANQLGNLGASDTARENRGFSIKFKTEDGNFDIPGLTLEVFGVKDPVNFPSAQRVIKKNPVTGLFDLTASWDFVTRRQETILNTMLLLSDLGIVDGFRHMQGFGVHAYAVYNVQGATSYVKFHFIPDAGIKTLTSKEAMRIQGEDIDYARRDLFEAILNGNYPSWTIAIQHVSQNNISNAPIDLFDVTLRWPIQLYPLIKIGKLVLNENPKNFFNDVEQLAFCPGNLVPGILGGVDKMFEARRFTYLDAQNYRLGTNFFNIAVNRPVPDVQKKDYTYFRDGVAPVGYNQGGIPNYYPNSFNGPIPYVDKEMPMQIIQPYTDPNPTNFGQSRELYENEMNDGERMRLVQNIVESLNGVTQFVQNKVVSMFTKVSVDLGNRIALGLSANKTNNAF